MEKSKRFFRHGGKYGKKKKISRDAVDEISFVFQYGDVLREISREFDTNFSTHQYTDCDIVVIGFS